MAPFAFYKVQIAVQPGVARDAFVDALNDALADALPSAGLRNAGEPYFELRAGAVRTGIVRMQGDAWDQPCCAPWPTYRDGSNARLAASQASSNEASYPTSGSSDFMATPTNMRSATRWP